MPHRIGFITRTIAALLAAFGVLSTAQAALYTVGTPFGPSQPCTHGSIQAAVDVAQNNPGADTIRITRLLTYTAQAVSINTAQELTLEGGYATCTQTTQDTTNTEISGAGGAAAPVFNITAPTGAWIRMSRLGIKDGDVATDGRGGGIRFSGNGILQIRDSVITNNTAGYGGGISASGTGADAVLTIGKNVLVLANTARYGGGGIYAHELKMNMIEPDSYLINNQATGVSGSAGLGGGLYLHANHRDAIAYIGTNGSITGNSARHGGGVALAGYNDDSGTHQYITLHLFSTDLTRRGSILGNTASVSGGGIYAEGDDDEGFFDGYITSYVHLWNATLSNNNAPDGAAARLAGDGYAHFYFNDDFWSDWPGGALRCAPEAGDCGRIAGNATMNGATLTQGAILRTSGEFGSFRIGRTIDSDIPMLSKGGIVISGNRGGRLFDDADSESFLSLTNGLIVSNEFSQQLIRATNAYAIDIFDTTIANNIFGPTPMLATGSADLTIHRSILWQPGKILLNRNGGSPLDTAHNLVNETGSFPGTVIVANPLFVDPAHGDFSLRVGSPAIDRAPAITGDDRDLLGNPRDRDLPYTEGDSGLRDIGAFERQALQPMVLNKDFDIDLRLWDVVTAGSTTRDTTQNASGAANSGSAHVTRASAPNGQETPGISHCILLPGPALYALNGYGRGTGTGPQVGDVALLRWEYRRNGFESCGGTPDASGFLTLSNSGSWNRPLLPALIDVTQANWGPTASIKVTLVAIENGSGGNSTNAWFDGITLEIVPQGPELFADGFED